MIDAIQGRSQINNILPNILQSSSGGGRFAGAKKAPAAKADDKANIKITIDTKTIDTKTIDIDKTDIKNTDINQAEKQKSNAETPKVNYNELTDKLKTIIDSKDQLIEFSRDEDTKKMVLKIIDFDTREVIHQFPPEVTLKIARFVTSTLNTGNLTNAKV